MKLDRVDECLRHRHIVIVTRYALGIALCWNKHKKGYNSDNDNHNLIHHKGVSFYFDVDILKCVQFLYILLQPATCVETII